MSDVEPAAQFPLRRRALVGLWVWIGAALLVFLDPSLRSEGFEDVALWIGVAVGAVLLPVIWTMFVRQRVPQILEVSRDRLRVPISMDVLEIPLSEIEGLAFEEGRRAGLFVSTERFDTFIPASRFVSGEAARAAYSAIRARIEALPSGAARLKTVESVGVEVSPRAWVTEGLLVLVVLVYVLELVMGALDSPEKSWLSLVAFGANSRALLARGEAWRLLSSAFLHGSNLHLALNAFGLWSLGGLSERLFGRANYLSIYLLAAVGGALGSAAIMNAPVSVGASTSLFGLVGAMIYAQIRHRDTIPLRLRIPDSSWYTLIALNLLLPVIFPVIDWVAHIVGAITGALVAMILIGDAERLPVSRSGWAGRVVAAVLGLATLFSFGMAARTARTWEPLADIGYLRALVNETRLTPGHNNAIAWILATRPESTPAALELADRAVRRALDVASDASVVDTQALVAFRLGRTEEAVRLEAGALQEIPPDAKDPTTRRTIAEGFASRLMLFLAGQSDRAGRLVDDGGLPDLTLALQDGRLAIRTIHRVERPTAVYVVAREGKDVKGMAIVQLMPTPPMIDPPIVSTSPLELPWASTASITIAYVTKGNIKPKVYTPDPAATPWIAE